MHGQQNIKIHNLCYSSGTIRVFKPKRIRRAYLVARTGQKNAYKIWWIYVSFKVIISDSLTQDFIALNDRMWVDNERQEWGEWIRFLISDIFFMYKPQKKQQITQAG